MAGEPGDELTSAAAASPDPGEGRPATAPTTKVPLAGESAGHLRIKRGLDHARITADPKLPDLLHGWWRRRPGVAADDGLVTLTYPRFRRARRGTNDITLNASVPWDITVDGGVCDVQADLRLLKLRSLTVEGAVSRVVLVLGKPRGEVPIELRSADRVTIRRPAESQLRIQITGGAAQVVVDDQTYGAIGGNTVLTTGPVLRNAYHVKIAGAHRLRVATL